MVKCFNGGCLFCAHLVYKFTSGRMFSDPSCIGRHTCCNCAGCCFTRSLGLVITFRFRAEFKRATVFTFEAVGEPPPTPKLDGDYVKSQRLEAPNANSICLRRNRVSLHSIGFPESHKGQKKSGKKMPPFCFHSNRFRTKGGTQIAAQYQSQFARSQGFASVYVKFIVN